MRKYVVEHAHEVTGRGTAVGFEGDPSILLPLGQRSVVVTTPEGKQLHTTASVEAARKVPPGEVLMLLFGNHSPEDIPLGSTIKILDT